jgi:hypothetical protein
MGLLLYTSVRASSAERRPRRPAQRWARVPLLVHALLAVDADARVGFNCSSWNSCFTGTPHCLRDDAHMDTSTRAAQ